MEDDNDEQLEDDEGVAAAEHEMESETVGHLDEGEGGPAEEAKSPAKSLVFARKRSTKVVKQPARRRFREGD